MGSVVRDVWDRWRVGSSPDEGAGPIPEPRRTSSPVAGLRHRRRDDIGACIRLLNVVHLEDGYPRIWPESPRVWLSGDEVLDAFVVERLREILGHVAVTKLGADATAAMRWRELTGLPIESLGGVGRLYVRQRARRQGIGSALLEAAADAARSRDLVPVLDAVSAGAEVLPLADSHGWRLLATYPIPGGTGGHTHYYWQPS